jgi:deoxyribodipyrimidine photo-lyase
MSYSRGQDLRRDFGDRPSLIAYLREQFPEAVAVDEHTSPMRGGRQAAEQCLAAVDPVRYAQTRNHLSGAVTHLSPYLRHGVLSLAEVRAAVLAGVKTPQAAERLITELGWRDYWQRLYAELGDGIWRDLEPYKTGWAASSYEAQLPEAVKEGQTALACMDNFVRDLRRTGYLHNHARLWLAAYIVHWRRVRWQAGAIWFLSHLLDGDPASNNLSWQWVASTFSSKPYYFNRSNLERYTDSHYCQGCSHASACPFDRSYEQLALALFPQADFYHQEQSRTKRKP